MTVIGCRQSEMSGAFRTVACLTHGTKGNPADKSFFRLGLEAAREAGIPVQTKEAVAGGNESGAIQQSWGGCKVLAVSVPCRYIHSPVSVASLEDIENTIRLTQAILNKLL